MTGGGGEGPLKNESLDVIIVKLWGLMKSVSGG